MKKSINHIYLIILLAILSAIAPIAVDTYIPSMPSMAKDFAVSIDKIELSLSIFLIGFSIGQIFGGILSDRIGRKRSSLIGLLTFAFFSFLIVFSSSVYELWIYRALQAFSGGLIVVNGSAAVRDIFKGKEAAKIFSLIGTVRSLAPLFAPAIGSFIIHFYSWRAVFVFLTVYALVVAVLIFRDFEETYTYTKKSVMESYKSVLSHKKAMKMMFILALGFSGMFTVIAKSSFIYIEYFNISTDMFPLFFGLNFAMLIIMIRINIILLKTTSVITLIKTAIFIQICAGTVFMLNSSDISLVLVVILLAVYMSMNGFIYGNTMALVLENFPHNAGVASSVIGVIQFGLGALISSFVLMFHSASLFPVAMSITVISLIAFFILYTDNKIGKHT